MDAVRLIRATRHALARCEELSDIVAESWQAQALAEAVGCRLALAGPPEVRTEASGLCEAGGRARGTLRHPAGLAVEIRAARLTEIRDPCRALRDLGGLLGESGAALVQVAVVAEEEALYWQCLEAIDAADESGDRVAAILRRLALRS
ncbi:DUF6099 family protein [Streptomyces gobiensis]|uniref:DUF6099 family protein n=1 Tax=Streptomyces gobiensis TaxID=2875706 RepID=UPI001E60D660|nr:DUF6099 family protein [Streptomyces gobiensis]UGY94090.1 DUF6099 family protein [Streptomyces gobiensis]